MPGHAGSQPPPSASAGPPPGPAGTAPGGASLQAVGRRLAKESTMVIAQTVLVKGVTIISSILLARILGPGTDVIDANEEMWRFFRRFALPAVRR